MRATALFFFSLLFAVPAPSPQTSAPQAYLGFDRNDYPGAAALPILRKSFSFTGYWLSYPPREKSNSWSGKRELLRFHGFGFALLFAGPTSGELRDEPYTLKRVAEDTQAAAAAARRDGFPSGSIIFLDVEEGGRLPSTYFTYLKLWASELARLGFRAGVYCSSIPIDEDEGLTLITSDFIREQLGPTELAYWVTTMLALHRLDVLSRKILRPLRKAGSPTHRSGNSFVPHGTRKPPFTAPATQKTDTAMPLAIPPTPGSWI